MNALSPARELEASAIAVDSLLEGYLERIARLANAASLIVESQLGDLAPAPELDALLTCIRDLAEAAEAVRSAGN